jgi:hypothetical protein
MTVIQDMIFFIESGFINLMDMCLLSLPVKNIVVLIACYIILNALRTVESNVVPSDISDPWNVVSTKKG